MVSRYNSPTSQKIEFLNSNIYFTQIKKQFTNEDRFQHD